MLICLIISSNIENLKANTHFLVSIGMNGPNVNKSYKWKLVNKLVKDKGNRFLFWLVCITHCEQGSGKVWNKGNNGRQTFYWHVFLLQVLISEEERYKEMENIRDITADYILKYCSTQWLYIGKVSWAGDGNEKWKTSRSTLWLFWEHEKDSRTKIELVTVSVPNSLRKHWTMSCCY